MSKDFKKILAGIKYHYGLNQSEVASKIGVNRSYISNMSAGINPVTDSIMRKLEDEFPKAFQVTAGDHSQIIHNNSGTAINGGDEKTVVDRMQDQIDSLLAQNDKLLAIIENLTKK